MNDKRSQVRRIGGLANDPVQEPAISDELAPDLAQHAGRWVALNDEQIVAVGDSAAEVLHEAADKHVTDPLVFRVPTPRGRHVTH